MAGVVADTPCCDIEATGPGAERRGRKAVEPCIELAAPDVNHQLVGGVLGGGSVVGVDALGAHRDERMPLPVDDKRADSGRCGGFDALWLHGDVAVRAHRNGGNRCVTAARRYRGRSIRSVDEPKCHVSGREQSQAGDSPGVAVEPQLSFLSLMTCECYQGGNITYILTLIVNYVNRGWPNG